MIRHVSVQDPVKDRTAWEEASRTEQFVQLLSKYQQRVHSFILTLVPHWADAEEVLQETNTILWRKFDQFEAGSDFVRWANQVAFYEVLKYRRRRHKDFLWMSEGFIEDVAQEVIKASDQLQAQRDSLANCLEKLSDRDRLLVQLRYQQGSNVKRVAELLSRPVDSVYKSLGRIRRALLDCVGRTMAMEERE